MTEPAGAKAILITRLAEELPADEALTALAMAMQELALAQALVIIHGRARGSQRYLEAGGHIRFTDDGEPVILWRPP